MLACIRKLAPAITARAAEIEANREVPHDLVDALRSIGVFRIFLPQSHGGLEFALPEALEIIEALARIDGSVGWFSMIGSGGALVTPLLPKESYEEVYKDGPNVIIAGSAIPLGTAEQIDDGWLVNGRWPFASGCMYAGWMLGLCVMTSGGKPLQGATEGRPLIKAFLLPVRRWQVEDTWRAMGLKGTGSHHIALKDAIVPETQFFEIGGKPCVPGALYRAVASIIPILHGAIAVGIAEGALDDLLQLANTGWKQLRGTMPVRDSETFQGELGRISADVRATRAFLQGQAASIWGHALAGALKDSGLASHALPGTLSDSGLAVQATQAAIWLATTCLRATDACFALGGSNALYESSPLQRRLRDMRTAAQHGVVQQRNYVAAGKWLLDNFAAFQSHLPRMETPG
jgi:alkylation response protein AidB-like acyl-CoA dehydrogenase